MRKHEVKIEIAASPAEVWEAIATGQGIQSWFCPIASVEPGAGGKTTIKWTEGMEASPRIEIWEPDRHLQTSSDRPAPAPPNVVDYFIEGSGGATTLRLVHSGFGESADFDGEYESTGGAWPVFLKLLKHSVEHGVKASRNVTLFRMLPDSAATAWEKLTPHLTGVQRHFSPTSHCSCFEQEDGAMIGIFCESCGGAAMLTLMHLLYGVSTEKAEAVREHWSGILNQLFGEPK
jgi:uncharacterized protein YndB with AHSA1/START domain